MHINLAFSGNVPMTMTVKRLSIPSVSPFFCACGPSSLTPSFLSHRHADDTSGLTWGGQSYETSDGRVNGVPKVELVNVSNGVDIQETEVVLLSFH